jgi:hypothetical protein
MKNLFFIFCMASVIFTSCSSDGGDGDTSIVGTWKLTTWSINMPLDLNNDGVSSTNLLDEVGCTNNETLVFEANGVISSNDSFNPKIAVILLDDTANDYVFDIVCAEGVIGFATSYTQTNDNTVVFNDKESTISGHQLSCVYEDAIKIYNEDLTEVVATKNLTLVYTKQ